MIDELLLILQCASGIFGIISTVISFGGEEEASRAANSCWLGFIGFTLCRILTAMP